MTRAPRVHYLRANKGERSPHRLLVVDTESRTIGEERREIHVLRCWASRLITRHGREGKAPARVSGDGWDAASLVELIEGSVRTTETLWVFTHNLSFDLVLTRAPLALLSRGWELGRHNLASDAPWALLRRGSKSIRLADSWSWLPVGVATLGEALGLAKPDLPSEDDSPEVWMARCRADAEITAQAIEGLMDEWDERRLGWWSITGPATAWNSMLHMGPEPTRRSHAGPREQGEEGPAGPARKSPVIDPDAEARAFERTALYSGRRDVWRHGKVKGGPFVDLDFRSAHLAVCAHMLLPAKRSVAFESLTLDDWHLHAQETDVIAEAVVTPRTPRYPLRWGGQVLHPVGRFKTTLAGPELREALRLGELESVGRGFSYRLSPHMRTWASWAWAILHGDAAGVDPLLRVFIKGASRSVPGRWGMLISREVRKGPTPLGGWSIEPLMVGSPPRRGAIVRINGEWSEQVRDEEGEDSFPAVLAFIQSWARLLVGRAIDALGEGNVLQCNTDSMLVPASRLMELGREVLVNAGGNPDEGDPLAVGVWSLARATLPLEPRIKRTAARVVIRSPQHLRLDEERRYAGVPRSAVEIAPESFRFWTWPKLAGQLERGDPRGYVREERTLNLSALSVNRWAFEDGCCEPVEAAWSPEAGNLIQGPPGRCQLHGARLSASQHKLLRPLVSARATEGPAIPHDATRQRLARVTQRV